MKKMYTIRKGFKPQTLLIKHKEGKIVSNKEKVLLGGLNSKRSILNCKMEQTMSIQTTEPYAEPTNGADIQMVTGKLKNGKETGDNKISAKLIKWEEKSSRSHL